MSPKIILVTLIHNRRDLVGLALQSAVNQTLPTDSWRHLVIDNASTDGADLVAEAFARKYSHIHFERMGSNLHQMPAYNWALKWIAITHPDAEIMVHLDSDDMLVSSALQHVLDFFEAHPEVGLSYSGFNIIDKKGRAIHKNHAKAREVPDQFSEAGQLALRRLFVTANPCGHLRAMRLSALEDVGGFDESHRYATDYNMAGRIMERHVVAKIPHVLYNWRQHDTQVERQYSPEQTKNWSALMAFYKARWKGLGIL